MVVSYAPPPSPVQPLQQQLTASGELFVTEHAGVVTATRRRSPWIERGFLRVFLPWMVVRVRQRGAGARWTIRPDAIARGMLVLMIGGLLTELLMDRAKYPREYPPSFVYGLAGSYLTLVVIEVVRTRRAVLRALSVKPPRAR